jgi:predicted oxidoreductase
MLQEKLQFSRIIQGVMNWGAWGAKMSTQQMAEQIEHVLNLGITTFDHADIYGGYTTEAEFGKAFKESGVNRKDVQLISKLGIQYLSDERPYNRVKHYQYDATYILENTERSLQKLNTNYLDLLLLHRPSPLMDPLEIKGAIERLLTEGKIKSFGVSNFTPSQVAMLEKHIKVSGNQIECSITQYEPMLNGVLDDMVTKDILPMAWSPLGSIFKEHTQQTMRVQNVLETLRAKYRTTTDQILIAWLLKHPSGIHPVIGTSKVSHAKAAVKAQEINLDIQDWFELLIASQGHKVP